MTKENNTVTAVVESPKGGGYKYSYDPDLQKFRLRKILPAGLVFPFDFGFIPGTKGGDGDPLDVIILSEVNGFPGCVIDCRIIGAIVAEQTERNGETMRNDRLLGVAEVSELFTDTEDISQLPGNILEQVEAFFKNYNAQAGKKFKVIDRAGAEAAIKLLRDHQEGGAG